MPVAKLSHADIRPRICLSKLRVMSTSDSFQDSALSQDVASIKWIEYVGSIGIMEKKMETTI